MDAFTRLLLTAEPGDFFTVSVTESDDSSEAFEFTCGIRVSENTWKEFSISASRFSMQTGNAEYVSQLFDDARTKGLRASLQTLERLRDDK